MHMKISTTKTIKVILVEVKIISHSTKLNVLFFFALCFLFEWLLCINFKDYFSKPYALTCVNFALIVQISVAEMLL